MRKPERRGLGRGLSALMADVSPEKTAQESGDAPAPKADRTLPIDKIIPNPEQPRRHFSQEALEELAESIRVKGVIQPIIVRPSPDGSDSFQIIAGERRWRASQLAQLHELPVIVRDMTDTEVLEVAIIENIQRADLNPIEEAMGYRQLMERFGHTQEKLAEALSKSRSHIANLMRLLTLPEEIQDHVQSGRLSAGHARALITSEDPLALARDVIGKGLSVRETEQLAKEKKPAAKAPAHPTADKDADTRGLEGDLSANLGLKVRIQHDAGKESGAITLHYADLDQLDMICGLLSVRPLDASK